MVIIFNTVKKHKTQLDKCSSATKLKRVLDEILADPTEHIKLIGQDTLIFNTRAVFDAEFFACFECHGETINTGDLFAIASQYQKTSRLDLTIIKLILNNYKLGKFAAKTIAINLSRLTFADESSMADITAAIKESGLGKSLVIGITESSILGDIEQSC